MTEMQLQALKKPAGRRHDDRHCLPVHSGHDVEYNPEASHSPVEDVRNQRRGRFDTRDTWNVRVVPASTCGSVAMVQRGLPFRFSQCPLIVVVLIRLWPHAPPATNPFFGALGLQRQGLGASRTPRCCKSQMQRRLPDAPIGPRWPACSRSWKACRSSPIRFRRCTGPPLTVLARNGRWSRAIRGLGCCRIHRQQRHLCTSAASVIGQSALLARYWERSVRRHCNPGRLHCGGNCAKCFSACRGRIMEEPYRSPPLALLARLDTPLEHPLRCCRLPPPTSRNAILHP